MNGNADLNLKIGNTRCRCSGCREYFNSVGAFDKHRVGSGAGRRCWSLLEMVGHGMVQNSAGYWCSAAYEFQPRAAA